ncbi:hypothetical protein [Bradyrhizobium sp. F1.13.3]|uniref:hypothetical protein n=1 Tax=Bradyrhizobium sp. F1.13.3 TaxID=3156351 RepID=UPI003395BAD2
MRYYRIEIDGGSTVFTSFLNGQNLRGALQVELDIPVAAFHTPGNAGAFVKVWGIPLSMISQAKDLAFKTIKVYGGFQKGLPLANPKQAGLLVQGYIFQCFGNWQGTDMSLDLITVAGPPPAAGAHVNAPPKTLSLNWRKGRPLSEAINSMFSVGYPGMIMNVNLNDNLVAPEDQPHVAPPKARADYLLSASKSIINRPDYQGVNIAFDGNTINVYDKPNTTAPRAPGLTGLAAQPSTTVQQVAFVDLIGQPTWIGPLTIAFKCAMRADIALNDEVQMPKTLIANTAQAQGSLIKQKAAQQGTFLVTSVHHYGNFRQHDAYSWVTEFNAIATNVQGTTSTASP